ncbi:MAG: hypothetical protein WCC95_20410, partial [Candidatus Sulfotelmatobacter sp.]
WCPTQFCGDDVKTGEADLLPTLPFLLEMAERIGLLRNAANGSAVRGWLLQDQHSLASNYH